MVVGSNPVAVTETSDFAPVSSKEFLDIQATIECGFTLKRVRDIIKTYSLKIVFKIKTGYKLELLTNERMKLLGDRPIIDTDKNSTNLPQLEIVTTILVHCNIVQNNYQQASKVLCTFVPDKSFGQLISIHPSSFIELKTTDAEFNFIEV